MQVMAILQFDPYCKVQLGFADQELSILKSIVHCPVETFYGSEEVEHPKELHLGLAAI